MGIKERVNAASATNTLTILLWERVHSEPAHQEQSPNQSDDSAPQSESDSDTASFFQKLGNGFFDRGHGKSFAIDCLIVEHVVAVTYRGQALDGLPGIRIEYKQARRNLSDDEQAVVGLVEGHGIVRQRHSN